jgi:hypothetical protein
VQAFLAPGEQRDASAAPREGVRHSAADSAGSAGYHHDLVVHAFAHLTSWAPEASTMSWITFAENFMFALSLSQSE